MLELGADPEIVSDPDWAVPIEIAVAAGSAHIAEVLLAAMRPAGQARWHAAPAGARLMRAAALADLAAVRAILSSAPTPAQDHMRRALLETLDRDARDVARVIVELGLDARGATPDGRVRTPPRHARETRRS